LQVFGARANITAASFADTAVEYAETILPGQQKIVLIDGERLAQLMIDHDIGVSKVISYDLKRIDSDYFSEE
jgi:restriction system protein